MALRKITFDGATVSSKDDADINFHIFDLIPAGIIKGLGSEVSVSAGNNTITFGAGYIQIYGRRIYMESNTQVPIILDGNRNGFIVVDLNLAQNTLELNRLEVTSGWPSLVQNNLATTIGRYQFPIARYSKTSTSLSLDVGFTSTRPIIKTLANYVDEEVNKMQSWVVERFGNKIIRATSPRSNVTRYELSDFPGQLSECLIHARIGNIVTFTFSGRHLASASMQSLHYRHFGVDYTLGIEYTPTHMFLVPNNTTHRVTLVEVFK